MQLLYRIHRFALPTCWLLLVGPGCEQELPTPPSQQAVEQAWQRADQATAQVEECEQRVQNERRLRDIDRLRSAAEARTLETQAQMLRVVASVLLALALACLIWLAIEIRRRRVLSAVVTQVLETRGLEEPADTGPPRRTS